MRQVEVLGLPASGMRSEDWGVAQPTLKGRAAPGRPPGDEVGGWGGGGKPSRMRKSREELREEDWGAERGDRLPQRCRDSRRGSWDPWTGPQDAGGQHRGGSWEYEDRDLATRKEDRVPVREYSTVGRDKRCAADRCRDAARDGERSSNYDRRDQDVGTYDRRDRDRYDSRESDTYNRKCRDRYDSRDIDYYDHSGRDLCDRDVDRCDRKDQDRYDYREPDYYDRKYRDYYDSRDMGLYDREDREPCDRRDADRYYSKYRDLYDSRDIDYYDPQDRDFYDVRDADRYDRRDRGRYDSGELDYCDRKYRDKYDSRDLDYYDHRDRYDQDVDYYDRTDRYDYKDRDVDHYDRRDGDQYSSRNKGHYDRRDHCDRGDRSPYGYIDRAGDRYEQEALDHYGDYIGGNRYRDYRVADLDRRYEDYGDPAGRFDLGWNTTPTRKLSNHEVRSGDQDRGRGEVGGLALMAMDAEYEERVRARKARSMGSLDGNSKSRKATPAALRYSDFSLNRKKQGKL